MILSDDNQKQQQELKFRPCNNVGCSAMIAIDCERYQTRETSDRFGIAKYTFIDV